MGFCKSKGPMQFYIIPEVLCRVRMLSLQGIQMESCSELAQRGTLISLPGQLVTVCQGSV